jgi:hypothetical protein
MTSSLVSNIYAAGVTVVAQRGFFGSERNEIRT